jgi:fibronectin-binding autotransporter adhesin
MHLKNCASKRALLAGVSIIAALATASSVQAACTTTNGTVTCTGDNQSFTVTSDAQTTIAEGATVTGSGLSAIHLNSTGANLRIDGTISATGAAALTVQNGNRVLVYDPNAGAAPLRPYVYPYYYPTGRATIVVGEKGKISRMALSMAARARTPLSSTSMAAACWIRRRSTHSCISKASRSPAPARSRPMVRSASTA